ncbi:MAG: hypothetical protein IPG63_14780 [Xanthomonadales bacterium]|nr:hypothetical protein [Xanthomonadales bacterium]
MSRVSFRFCLIAVLAAPAAAVAKPVFDPLNSPVPATTKAAPAPAAAVPAKAPVAPVPAKAPVVATSPAAAAPAQAAFDPLHAAGPRVVAFDELEQYVGKAIQIKTNMRTTRKGTLKRFNRAGLIIADVSRGFSMEIDIPRSTVVEVQVKD